jgi:ABC-2 type transport system ATP-binding protein
MIQIDNLIFSYNRKQKLFDSLNLNLPSGNIFGLLGKNGAGKTTLLKTIAGLLFPKHGSIQVEGFRPIERNPQFLSEIFFVAEEFEMPALSIDCYINIYSPFYPRFNHALLNEYLNEFKIPLKQKLSSLSYGQKKNFLLSFGLATDCKLLILDEPTNGLDIPSKSLFRKIVANAIHEERSFIISTHQVRDMENLIDPIIILDEGKIIFNQTCEEITKKVSFSRQTDEPGKHTLYYEQMLGGYAVVSENHSGEETKLNLEMLFNAFIGNKEQMTQLFNN